MIQQSTLNQAGMVLTGTWSQAESEQVTEVALQVAERLPDFRRIFTPLAITRIHRDNVDVSGTSMWYAKNVGGYQLILGNRVFFEGKQSVRRFPGTHFTSAQLIAHELCHTLNFRYGVMRYAHWYQDNRLLGFVARSSDLPAEIITDAIANYALGTLKDERVMRQLFAEVTSAALKPRVGIPLTLQPLFERLENSR